MSDIECNLCHKDRDEDYGTSYDGYRYDFECNDCRVGDCGVCEQPVKGGADDPNVQDCTHCANYMHETCVITNSDGDPVCKDCVFTTV